MMYQKSKFHKFVDQCNIFFISAFAGFGIFWALVIGGRINVITCILITCIMTAFTSYMLLSFYFEEWF
jgi:hypothetical protein